MITNLPSGVQQVPQGTCRVIYDTNTKVIALGPTVVGQTGTKIAPKWAGFTGADEAECQAEIERLGLLPRG